MSTEGLLGGDGFRDSVAGGEFWRDNSESEDSRFSLSECCGV